MYITKEWDKSMTKEEIVNGLEIYTLGRLKKSQVHITVEELQKYIDEIKALDNNTIDKQAVLDIINFEDKWLFDAKSHNADTKIAFSAMKSQITEMSSTKTGCK